MVYWVHRTFVGVLSATPGRTAHCVLKVSLVTTAAGQFVAPHVSTYFDGSLTLPPPSPPPRHVPHPTPPPPPCPDPKGSEPLSFQLGALPHFKTEDQSKHGEFVRVLGLGGSIAYDWTHDSRKPRVVGVDDDYVTFDGELALSKTAFDTRTLKSSVNCCGVVGAYTAPQAAPHRCIS